MQTPPLLAFDTSTDRLSIALTCRRDGVEHAWHYQGEAGAKASAHMIEAILNLLQQAQIALPDLQAIVLGAGPGYFTGLRTAFSVAQGLALSAGIPLLPIDTLLAVAEEARWTQGWNTAPLEITALLDARMDELYAARYRWDGQDWQVLQSSHLVKPEQCSPSPIMAGNVFALYGARIPTADDANVQRVVAYPTASALLRLAPQFLRQGAACAPEQALPVYVRDKVAETTAERLAKKQGG